MVSGRIETEERDVERVGHPSQWVPVGLLGCGDRPRDGIARQALAYVQIFGDVAIVVIVDEGMAVDRVVERQRDDRKQKTHDGIALFSGREESGRFRLAYSFGY